MGSACTLITVGTVAPVCSNNMPCATGSTRQCRSDNKYWDCVSGCWKQSADSCACINNPCDPSCTDCARCPTLASCNPCIANPCGSTCKDCVKCPSLAMCQVADPCASNPCGSTCAGYPNCAKCPTNPGCTVVDPCIANPCGSTCKDCSKCPTLASCPVDPCIANPCLDACAGHTDCKICPEYSGCKTTPVIPPIAEDPCELNPCLSVCPDALRIASQCPGTKPGVVPGLEDTDTEEPASECEGFNRNGQFDMSCAMQGQTGMFLIGGLVLLGGILLISRKG